LRVSGLIHAATASSTVVAMLWSSVLGISTQFRTR
jgi:hypothetical protein